VLNDPDSWPGLDITGQSSVDTKCLFWFICGAVTVLGCVGDHAAIMVEKAGGQTGQQANDMTASELQG
jgi:hypothetical protein